MNRYCLVLLSCLPLAAVAYPIEVEKRLDGVKVDASASDPAPDLGAITLSNYGQVPAACKVTFRNGPEAPRIRRLTVEPGQRADATMRFHREVLRLRIMVDCTRK